MTSNQLNALTEQQLDQVSGGASDVFHQEQNPDGSFTLTNTTGSTVSGGGNGGIEGTPPGNGTTNVIHHFTA